MVSVTDLTLVGLVAAALIGVVVLAVLVFAGVMILRNFRDRQVAAQDRTARLGEEALREMQAEFAETTPAPAPQDGQPGPAPVAGAGEAAIGPAMVAHQRERGQIAGLREQVAGLREQVLQQQQPEEDPLVASYKQELDWAKQDLTLASIEYAGVRTEGRAIDLEYRSALGRLDNKERRNEIGQINGRTRPRRETQEAEGTERQVDEAAERLARAMEEARRRTEGGQ